MNIGNRIIIWSLVMAAFITVWVLNIAYMPADLLALKLIISIGCSFGVLYLCVGKLTRAFIDLYDSQRRKKVVDSYRRPE